MNVDTGLGMTEIVRSKTKDIMEAYSAETEQWRVIM